MREKYNNMGDEGGDDGGLKHFTMSNCWLYQTFDFNLIFVVPIDLFSFCTSLLAWPCQLSWSTG